MNLAGLLKYVQEFVGEGMKRCNTELTTCTQGLGKVNIKQVIFQGGSLYSLLFVTTVTPPTLILRKRKIFYNLKKRREKRNHLLFMVI